MAVVDVARQYVLPCEVCWVVVQLIPRCVVVGTPIVPKCSWCSGATRLARSGCSWRWHGSWTRKCASLSMAPYELPSLTWAVLVSRCLPRWMFRCVSKAQHKVISCLEWPLAVMGRLTTERDEARIHVVHMGGLSATNLEKRYRALKSAKTKYTHVVGFSVRVAICARARACLWQPQHTLCVCQPTGWAYRGTSKSRGTTHVLDVSPSGAMQISSADTAACTIMKCKKVVTSRRSLPCLSSHVP